MSESLAEVYRLVGAAAREVHRDPREVRVVVVTKTQPVERLEDVLQAGHRIFGENRVQEAKNKWPRLRQVYPDLELHLVGPLQTNKVKEALKLFDVIETLDRPRLAQILGSESVKSGCSLRCFIQVNSGEEAQKSGILPREFESFFQFCRKDCGLNVIGVMCIPPMDEEPALHFALLTDLARRFGLPEISMGMSADFQLAVRLGATYVRIGTKIFGEREK